MCFSQIVYSFMLTVDIIVKQFSCSLALITHTQNTYFQNYILLFDSELDKCIDKCIQLMQWMTSDEIFGPNFYLHLSNILANKSRHHVCKVFMFGFAQQ